MNDPVRLMVNIVVVILKLTPIPRFGRPPARPVGLLDRALQNRYRPTARVTFLGHVAANCSDMWYGFYHGIGDGDYVVRDRRNRFADCIRKIR